MDHARAKRVDADAVPVIDIAPLRHGDDSAGVARALREASAGLGFLYVRGHGIPPAVIDAARRSAFAFFRLPERDKARVRIAGPHRGWLAQGGARMNDGAPADLKESFVWGFENERGELPDDHPLRGPNRWPAAPPDMARHATAWFDAASAVAHDLLRGFAIGLGLPPDRFLRRVEHPLSRASYVYYPPQSETGGAGRFGVGPHTDFGVLTVLCQDEVGGLQIRDARGEWLHAPPIDGTLVVNVGDLLARWTDGAFTSTPHRVVNDSGRERLSLVLAFDPDPDAMIDARDLFGAGHAAGQAPIRCGDYLLWRFGKAFDYRRG